MLHIVVMLHSNFLHLVTLLQTALDTRCSLQCCYIKLGTHFRTKRLHTIRVRFVDLPSLLPTWGKRIMNDSSGKRWIKNILSHSQTMSTVYKCKSYWRTSPHCAQTSLCVRTKDWHVFARDESLHDFFTCFGVEGTEWEFCCHKVAKTD